MAVRVNPRLVDDLERYGAEDVAKCYHCGQCSAVCPFSREPFLFPRRSMRFLQLGLEERLRGTLEPWLCYYCGECSEQCPRGAEPGETMMSMRRWLTAQYDFTGLSRLFYRSWRAEWIAILVVAILTGAAFLSFGFRQGSLHVYDGPGAFLPSHVIHGFDIVLALTLAALLGTNCVRMWWFSVWRSPGPRVPLPSYLRQAWRLPFHFVTQARWRDCDRQRPWVVHFVLVASYVSLFVLIVFFVEQMQSGPAIDWRVHGIGYAATLGLVGATIVMLHGRLRPSAPIHRHSHESDWIFLGLLLFVALTGVAQHVLHRSGAEVAANLMYVVHLMGAVPMLVVEVPFGKWAHMAYRPLAMYFAALHADALVHAKASTERPAARAA
jgi:quinone-modifying oxidoreductase, subunit QmoC